MTNLFIAPAAGPAALDHLEETVLQTVDLADLDGLADAGLALAGSTPNGVRAWGTQAGKDQIMVGTWETIMPGDWVLFYSAGHFPICGRVLVREHSPVVAERLWGSDDGGAWEYMYLIDELRQVDLPRPAVLQALDYSLEFYPRGFIRVNRDLEAAYGSVETLLDQLASRSSVFRRAIDASKSGDDAAAAIAIEEAAEGLPDGALEQSIASYTSSDAPEVQTALVKKIKRDRKLVAQLKALYEGRCQWCDFTFSKADGSPYSEGAHLKPMAALEADLDVKDNIVVICANHHRMLDEGALTIAYDPDQDVLLGTIDDKTSELINKHIGPDRP